MTFKHEPEIDRAIAADPHAALRMFGASIREWAVATLEADTARFFAERSTEIVEAAEKSITQWHVFVQEAIDAAANADAVAASVGHAVG